MVVLPAKMARGTPLLVALHGDEGDPALVASLWGPVTSARGVILFAPQCPTSSGCRANWWAWLQSGPTYDERWLGRQAQLVERRYTIDRKREYIAGWSGGADFLGWYALRHASASPLRRLSQAVSRTRPPARSGGWLRSSSAATQTSGQHRGSRHRCARLWRGAAT